MVEIERIEEHVVNGKRLGWHRKPDPRRRNYPARRANVVSDVLWPVHPGAMPLDQGRLGSCTANACVGAFNCVKNFRGRGLFFEKDAVWLYGNEQVEEGFARDADNGGTGVDVCTVAKAAGWIHSFTHAFDFDGALQALMLSPGLIGCNWYGSMDTPDANGVVQIPPGATLRGGHMFLAVSINTTAQLVGCWNSWGPGWGVASPDGTATGGFFYLPFAVLQRLIAEQGDFTVPARS